MKSPVFLFPMHLTLTCIQELQYFLMELTHASQGKLHILLEIGRFHPNPKLIIHCRKNSNTTTRRDDREVGEDAA